MPYTTASAVEIDKKLRDDFRRRLKDFGISSELTDPILAVLFRTFAQQLEALYSDVDRIRLALLDELINNLGMDHRMARPAQTVVRFLLDREPQLVSAGTEMFGTAQSGERLTFTTDATCCVSGSRIAFAATYQDGSLQLISGVDMPEDMQALRPSSDAVRADLGPNPAIYLAIENLPQSHLSRQSFFFELGPDAHAIQETLDAATWCLVDAGGRLGSRGILRPTPINGGVRELQWLLPDGEQDATDAEPSGEVPRLSAGFYGSRVFLVAPVARSRAFSCKVPQAMESGLGKIFGSQAQRAFARERAWVRISLPREIPSLQTSIGSIAVNAMTASNVECLNQTISFEKQGNCIPVNREAGGSAQHFVAPLSIFGESGTAYLPEMQPSSDANAGRYAIRNGRIELRAALSPSGRADTYANIRLWVTSGKLGNTVGPDRITGFAKTSSAPGVRVVGLTAATGGSDQEELNAARLRFAETLLSRDRIVTRDDLLAAVRAFDVRIQEAEQRPGVARTRHGLQRIERISIRISKDDFVDPETELRILRDDLTRHLSSRFPYGTQLKVEVEP